MTSVTRRICWLPKVEECLGARFLAEQLAEQAHGRFGVVHRVVAKIDIDHWNTQGVEFLDVASVFSGMLGFDVENDHVRLLGDRLLDVERAVFKAAEGGNLPNVGEFAQVGAVGVRVGLDQVLAPTDDALDRVLRIQCGDQVQLTTFAENHPSDRQVNLDLAAQQVGHRNCCRVLNGGNRVARCQ